MEVMHKRVAGIDIGKQSATVAVRVQGSGSRATSVEVTDHGSMTRQILALREYLITAAVTCIVMESTSDYWKPYYYVLEDLIDAGVQIILANAAHVKNVPGRKTDVNDATWLAELAAHGLIRSSFVPPPPIRDLRDVTRARTAIARERVRELSRLEKQLEAPGIKLSVAASSLDGVSTRRMLHALVDGERDPEVLANLAVPQMLHRKHDLLVDALTGRFTDHDAFMIGLHLRHLDELAALIDELDTKIEVMIEPFRLTRDLLCTMGGVSTTVANVIIAETGGDMSVFPSADHLASWCGVAPGQHQSARTRKNAKATPGDSYLKGALGISAMTIAKSHSHTHLAVRFRRIRARRGFKRALVATERSLLTSAYYIMKNQVPFHELGGDHYETHHATKTRQRALAQLKQLGYDVQLTKTP